MVKRTDLRAFSRPRAGGIIAMGVREDDAVVGVELTDGDDDVFIGARGGKAIRFRQTDVRSVGRTAQGVRGISLGAGDEVVAMTLVRPGGTLLTVTERGYGKRTAAEEYRVQSRGGVGIINIHANARNGQVVGVVCVEQDDELMLVTQQGKILRMNAGDIRPIGRSTQGVRLIEIDDADRVVSIARLLEENGNANGEPEANEAAGPGSSPAAP